MEHDADMLCQDIPSTMVDVADTETAPASTSVAAPPVPRGNRMYEVIFEGRVYCSPSMGQIIKHLNANLLDRSKQFLQPSMWAVANGKLKSHHGATARIFLKNAYLKPEGSIFIPELSRDQYLRRRRTKPQPQP